MVYYDYIMCVMDIYKYLFIKSMIILGGYYPQNVCNYVKLSNGITYLIHTYFVFKWSSS